MAGFMSTNTDNLTRANIWTQELKDVFYADLMAQKYVRMLDFPDGDTLNIPSIGTFQVADYAEGQPVHYTAMDTGNFTFTINKYKQTGTYITRKAKQDLFYASQLVSSFVPKQMRAISEQMETDVLALAPDGQTASNLNAINGANHRFIGSGTNETIDVKDFALAANALDMANVPNTNRVAIVHPSVEFKLNTLTNLVNASFNPSFEGIVNTGFRTGMRFIRNIYGFDVYVSKFLKSGVAETINGLTTTVGVANLFFSAGSGDECAFVGAVRQAPQVDTEFNKDYQRDEYVVTCRYGYKLFRPEGVVVVLTDTDQVA
ncbi:MAG TPA: hypothetical protein VIY48_11520 [Candidatus Paceibacterota bacterium]